MLIAAEEVEASNGQSLSDKSPLLVKYVDLNICENCKNHHTDFYEIAKNLPSSKVSEENESNKKLVVRRGDSFKISVLFNKKYDSEKYNVQLQLQLGKFALFSQKLFNDCIRCSLGKNDLHNFKLDFICVSSQLA